LASGGDGSDTRLRDWLELYPTAMSIQDENEFTAARQQLDDICYQIAAIPSAGAAGLAIKAFLRHWVEENELFPLDKAILEDAARLVPETAPLVAEWLEHVRLRHNQAAFNSLRASSTGEPPDVPDPRLTPGAIASTNVAT
jgi:hypothetical protein